MPTKPDPNDVFEAHKTIRRLSVGRELTDDERAEYKAASELIEQDIAYKHAKVNGEA